MTEVHVSVGAGFENDRRDLGRVAAQALSRFSGPKYLIFECLAERTLARQVQAGDVAAQVALALSFVQPCWELCKAHGITIISNFGGIDPVAVAQGLRDAIGPEVRAVSVTGDSVPLSVVDGEGALAKNVYLGAAGIVDALALAPDIVVTGRVADPSLVVGAVVQELGVSWTNWDTLANATLAGHLIECGTQVTGGYFWDEGAEISNISQLGPPVVSINANHLRLQKPLGGGLLNRATVTEQLLYEIGDPSRYLTPDVVLDLTRVEIEEGDNEVIVTGAKGHPAPGSLKSLLCRQTGWIGEAEISYYGHTSAARARLACNILRARLCEQETRLDIFEGTQDSTALARVRLAIRARGKRDVEAALNEVEALYLNGPAGGGGVRKTLTPLVETEAALVERAAIGRAIAALAA